MKITLLVVGKTDELYLQDGIDKYIKRLKHSVKFKQQIIPDIKNSKNLSEEEQRRKEGLLLLQNINHLDYVILLDEHGKKLRSIEFAQFIEHKGITNVNNLVFVIGGPYGFDKMVYSRANEKLSLSPLTFSHQMIRLLFIEQLYRAFSIIRGDPYHHE